MKRSVHYLIGISLLSIPACPMFAVHRLIIQMEKAVEHADMVALKKFMRQFDREKLTLQERQTALAELALSCRDIAREQEDSSILSNRWDLAKCIGGAILTLCGTYYLVKNLHKVWTVPNELEQCETCGASYCDRISHTCLGCITDRKFCNHLANKGVRLYPRACRYCALTTHNQLYAYNCPNGPIGLNAGEKSTLYAKVFGSGGLTFFGLYYLYQGLTHTSQQEMIEATKGLEAYLNLTVHQVKR